MSKNPGFLRGQLAHNVRRLRVERGWSQEDLAALAELHRNQIGYIEKGERNVNLDTLERLVWAFGVEPGELLR